jgi:hypothetical protein
MTQPADSAIENALLIWQDDAVEELLHEIKSAASEYYGFPFEEDEESPHYGELRLPDGRHVDLYLKVEFSS